jgi:hypothetical protein
MRSHRNGEGSADDYDAGRRGRQVPRKAPECGQETYGSDHAGRHRYHHHWKLLSPERRRAAVAHLIATMKVSERFARRRQRSTLLAAPTNDRLWHGVDQFSESGQTAYFRNRRSKR